MRGAPRLERSARRVEPAVLAKSLTEQGSVVERLGSFRVSLGWSFVIARARAAARNFGFIDPATVDIDTAPPRARRPPVPRV